ncbi:MAG: MoxR-like ATPase, regulator [Bacteroidota bacterium]|jgi:MoxR-like ATPase
MDLNNEITPDATVENVAEAAMQSAFKVSTTELNKLTESVYLIKREMQKVIVGQDKTIDLMIIALLTGGHVLMEGMPGIAKTLMAKLLAKTIHVNFNRIQFTPDLMPTDVVGTSVFNMKTSEFYFSRGPIFSNIVLIDEINRSPAKTQAALFEVMEEQQVTVDGATHILDFPFMVLATQNPIEQEGTYKLPEAQLDRFQFRIMVDYPNLNEEKLILQRFKEDFNQANVEQVEAVITPVDLKKMKDTIQNIFIKDELVDYIAKIVVNTRNHPYLFLGASPRASMAILKSCKAMAAIKGREFVTPDDIRDVTFEILNHRIILTPEKEMEGFEPKKIIEDIIKEIEIPR